MYDSCRWDKLMPWLTSCGFHGFPDLGLNNLHCSTLYIVGKDFLRVLFLLLTAFLHALSNQTVLCFYSVHLFWGIFLLAIFINFLSNSLTEMSDPTDQWLALRKQPESYPVCSAEFSTRVSICSTVFYCDG